MGTVRDRNTMLSAPEIELLKMTQEVIKRMADNSAKTKTLFVGVTTAAITFLKFDPSVHNLLALLAYLVVTVALWETDARYLRLERLFRHQHHAIVDGSVPALELWRMNLSRYEEESVGRIMFTNFTMWIYQIAALASVVLLAKMGGSLVGVF